MSKARFPSPNAKYRRSRSRFRRIVVWTIFTVICVTVRALFRRHELFIQSLPTEFKDSQLPLPTDLLLRPDFEARYSFVRQLSHGQEGFTGVYNDTSRDDLVVVKCFHQLGEPARNYVPGHILQEIDGRATRWPTELPASLTFGGLTSIKDPRQEFGHDFVPVRDVFMAVDRGIWKWYMVSPLLPWGTLATYANNALDGIALTSKDKDPILTLDVSFRPAFDRILATLKTVHEADFCHDDIKPANIFVYEPTIWLLGDLGAVRRIDAAWHKTTYWSSANQWSDCQQNDLRRLIKTYLQFLRAATPLSHRKIFDDQFWRGDKPWSLLYWTFISERMNVDELHNLSKTCAHPSRFDGPEFSQVIGTHSNNGLRSQSHFKGQPPQIAPLRLFWTNASVLAFAVSRELTTKMEDYAKFWRLRDIVAFGTWNMERAVRLF